MSDQQTIRVSVADAHAVAIKLAEFSQGLSPGEQVVLTRVMEHALPEENRHDVTSRHHWHIWLSRHPSVKATGSSSGTSPAEQHPASGDRDDRGKPEHQHTLEHHALLDLLSELITRERDGRELYHQYVDDAPEEMRDNLVEYGVEIDKHVRLLERTIKHLGGDPSYLAPAAESARRLTQLLMELGETGPARWVYRLEAILLFETRDQIIWEILELLSRKGLEAPDAEVVRPAADEVESAEELGAYNASRHRERIQWARENLHTVALAQLDLDAPHRGHWQKLAHLFAP